MFGPLVSALVLNRLQCNSVMRLWKNFLQKNYYFYKIDTWTIDYISFFKTWLCTYNYTVCVCVCVHRLTRQCTYVKISAGRWLVKDIESFQYAAQWVLYILYCRQHFVHLCVLHTCIYVYVCFYVYACDVYIMCGYMCVCAFTCLYLFLCASVMYIL